MLRAAPGLTQEALRDGGLAVVGVTMVDEVEQVRPPLIEALEKVLRQERPDLPFRTAASVRDSLGPAEYRRLLAAYQSEGKLTDADRGALAAKLRASARYAILARVEKDAVRLPPGGRSVFSDPGAANSTFATRAASRDARFRVTVYDLSTGSEVWAAVYASSTEHVVPDSIPPIPDKLIIRPPGDRERPPDALPEAPSLASALVEGFRAFVADLPPPPRAAAPPDTVNAK